jgi:hypothetical protein
LIGKKEQERVTLMADGPGLFATAAIAIAGITDYNP